MKFKAGDKIEFTFRNKKFKGYVIEKARPWRAQDTYVILYRKSITQIDWNYWNCERVYESAIEKIPDYTLTLEDLL